MTAFGTVPKYIDGYYGSPVRISRTPRRYEFAGNGDVTTAEYDATYLVDQGKFTPTARGTVDPENAGFYLIAETKPDVFQGDIAQFVRTYSKIPLQQIQPSQVYVTKPTIPGTFPQLLNGSVITQPDPNVGSYDMYTPQAVTSDTGAAAATIAGGTFTLTYGASTTAAIAYNAPAVTIQAALNAIASISSGDGVTVTGSVDEGLTVQFNAHALPTLNTGSLTISGAGPIDAISTKYLYGSLGVQFMMVVPPGQSFTGGTFTVTLFGQTTAAIAYNASLATVQSAINALSNVSARGGVTAFYLSAADSSINPQTNQISFRIEFAAYGAISGTATLLIPSGSSITVTPQAITTVGDSAAAALRAKQAITFAAGTVSARSFTAPAHGITIADDIFVRIGEEYFLIDAGDFTVPDVNTIAIITGDAFTAVGAADLIGKRFGQPYTAGTKLTRCNRVTDFYLPGVTPGITTAEDIPLPVYQGDAASLLEAIFAGSTEINYEVGELQQWKDSPILVRTITKLNASLL